MTPIHFARPRGSRVGTEGPVVVGRARSNIALVLSILALVISTSAGSAYAATVITTRQIKNGAVTTAKLANGAASTAKIANGAVGTAKIANGSVTAEKLAAGALPSGLETTVVHGSVVGVPATCPSGYKVVGGGGSIGSLYSGNTAEVQGSYPSGNGWLFSATLYNQQGQSLGKAGTSYAICAR